MQYNDVPSRAKRVQISGCDPFACELFSANMLEMFLGPIIGFHKETKRPYRNCGLFRIVKAYLGGIESQPKKLYMLTLYCSWLDFPVQGMNSKSGSKAVILTGNVKN